MNNFKQKALIFAAASILAVTAPRIANARNAYFQNKKNADVPALYAPASAAKTKSAKDSTVESAFSKRLAKAKEVLMSYPEITSIPGIEASMEKPVGKCILLEFERMNCRKRLVKDVARTFERSMKIDAEIQCRFDSLVKANPDPDSVFRLSLLSEAFRNVMDRHEITYEPAYSFQYAYDGKHKDGKTRKYKLDCGTSTMQYAQSAGNNGFSVSCIHIEPREAQYRMTQVYGGVAPERHLLAMVMIGKNELCIETTWLLHGIEERDTLQRQDTLLTNSRELASYYGIKAKRDSLDSEILKLTGTIQRVNGMIAQSGEGAMCDGISLAAIKEAAEEVLKGRKDLYDAYTHDMHGIIAQNLMRNKIIPYGLWDAVKTATYPGSDAIKKSVDKTIDDYTR